MLSCIPDVAGVIRLETGITMNGPGRELQCRQEVRDVLVRMEDEKSGPSAYVSPPRLSPRTAACRPFRTPARHGELLARAVGITASARDGGKIEAEQ